MDIKLFQIILGIVNLINIFCIARGGLADFVTKNGTNRDDDGKVLNSW